MLLVKGRQTGGYLGVGKGSLRIPNQTYFIHVEIIHEFVEFRAVLKAHGFCSKQIPWTHLSRADDLDLVVVQRIHHRDESPSRRPAQDRHLRDVFDEQCVKVGAEFKVVCSTEWTLTQLLERKHGEFPGSLWDNELSAEEL